MPVIAFPTPMRDLAYLLPTYRYAELGRHASVGLAPNPVGTAILLGWTAVFTIAAGYAYRRFAATR